ncbi:MAG: exo-alpha-sialidase, partial [Oscillospiraceae bacterium]|nr:exo-alpha-sialidase [Oscillospiraceae bacterium]
MNSCLKAMEARLTDEQKEMLKAIREPVVVAVPLEDSRRDICVLPDGEIRSYGRIGADLITRDPGTAFYLSSTDCGLSWQKHFAKGEMHACTYIEGGDVYLTIRERVPGEDGVFVLRSKTGPDDPAPERIKVSDDNYGDGFLPMKSAFTDRVWFTAQKTDELKTIGFFFSDDFGLTWQLREITPPPAFETVFPHKGLRWCKGSGTEPYAAELTEDKMMLIIRSSTDQFWQCISSDGGESWSEPEPTTFYGTDTTAFLLRLSDGRMLTFWNNTKPLPEVNHSATLPPVSEKVRDGFGEDAFTNRDAAHAAISEDGGESWIGYREILLNEVRNNADFRRAGGDRSTRDKSVHQFQAFELPFGKILVSAGQNLASRKLLIFDADWLYETSREETFRRGMADLTVHTFLKSVSGSRFDSLGSGHCAWNRTYGAHMMPDPEGSPAEVLSVAKHHDDRLFNDIGGVCWNFPMARKGRVSMEMKILEKQARFVLGDRWHNTCDPFAAVLSPFWFELDVTDLPEGYATVDIDFDTDAGTASVL